MPLRKSSKTSLASIATELRCTPSTVVSTTPAPNWAVTAYDATIDVFDSDEPPIRRRVVTPDEALSISKRFGKRVVLVAESLEELPGRTIYPIPHILIAYGAVPANAIILSFSCKEAVELVIPKMIANSNLLLADRIGSAAPNIIDENNPSTMLYAYNSVEDLQWQIECTSEIPSSVRNWVDARFFAAFILDCCYLGRGCPVGLDFRYHINRIVSGTVDMPEFISRITGGIIQMPSDVSDLTPIPKWREKMLWNLRSEHRTQQAFKREERFRDRFSVRPFLHQNEDLAKFMSNLQSIKYAMKELIYAYDRGADNTVPDIRYDAPDAPNRLSDIMDELGMTNTIRGICMGIPVQDLILFPHGTQSRET